MKVLIFGVLMLLTTVCSAFDYANNHPFRCANYYHQSGHFYFKQCGRYFPDYQYPRFCHLVSHKYRYENNHIFHHDYPACKLHCRHYPAVGFYRLYTRDGLSVEHYFR